MGDPLTAIFIFLLVLLTVHRITFFLINDEGPARIVIRFKRLLGDDNGVTLVRPPGFGVLRELFKCPYCLSFWVTPLIVALAVSSGWVKFDNLSQAVLYCGGIWGAFFFLQYKIVERQ
jgi:hypothetical protein